MMIVKPHLGRIGNLENQDSGLDAVWCIEPGRPNIRVALAHRKPAAEVMGLVDLSPVQIEEVKAALRGRDCERPVSDGLTVYAEAASDHRLVALPLDEVGDDDAEDEDD